MGATVKVVAFPLRLGRRWAFQVLPSRAAGSWRTPVAGGTLAMLRELRGRLALATSLPDRMETTVRFAEEQMQDKWAQLSKSPAGTFRYRIYSLGKKLLDKVEPSEQFFKAIPQDATKINIIHPTSVNSRLARRRLRHLAVSGTAFHRRLLYGSIALLPISSLFAIVPCPNVVIMWNLFRAHAHWRALQGSQKLQELVTEDTDVVKASLIGNSHRICSWEFTPSEKLENLVNRANASSEEALSNEKIAAICKEYQLDTTDVTKWRDHTSKMLRLAYI